MIEYDFEKKEMSEVNYISIGLCWSQNCNEILSYIKVLDFDFDLKNGFRAIDLVSGGDLITYAVVMKRNLLLEKLRRVKSNDH